MQPHNDHVVGSISGSDMTLDELIAVNRCVTELRSAAERAFAAGQRRYGNELVGLADELVSLLQRLRPLHGVPS